MPVPRHPSWFVPVRRRKSPAFRVTIWQTRQRSAHGSPVLVRTTTKLAGVVRSEAVYGDGIEEPDFLLWGQPADRRTNPELERHQKWRAGRPLRHRKGLRVQQRWICSAGTEGTRAASDSEQANLGNPAVRGRQWNRFGVFRKAILRDTGKWRAIQDIPRHSQGIGGDREGRPGRGRVWRPRAPGCPYAGERQGVESLGMMAYTLRYADELRDPATVFGEIKSAKIDSEQLTLAKVRSSIPRNSRMTMKRHCARSSKPRRTISRCHEKLRGEAKSSTSPMRCGAVLTRNWHGERQSSVGA